MKRHAAYVKFVREWSSARPALPWWLRVIEIRGTKLHVAGLDSAWMAWKEKEQGDLIIGRYQVTQTVLHEEAQQADWRLALVHHPWDDLAVFDSREVRAPIHQHCDLLLRGHLHHPAPELVVPTDPSHACLELPTGCVYEDSQYPNAFQWIELSPKGKSVRVLFRAWLHNAWTIDRNQPGCPNGWWEVDLAAPAQPARGKQKSKRRTAAVIPSEYLAWLQRTCADVSLLGQDIQKGQAITLSQVCVPALTRPVVQRDELLTRSGLLLPRENDRAAFYHLSFQEYLAAERILRVEDDLWPIFRERSAVAEWRPTLMFLFAGKIAGNIWEWCDSHYHPTEISNPHAPRVLRGGSCGG